MASSSATAGTSNNIDFDEEAKNRQYRLDQMLEAKMISDILRANNNLKALKAFRVQNEASYKEKELVLVRNQEIREPLEAAIFQNDVMAGKLERREDMIRDLRRDLLLETIKSKLGSLDRTQSNRGPQLDQKDADELKQLSLQDQIAELNIIIHYNQNELKKCKRVIEIQFKKIKSLRDELEQSEYAFNERIKRIDSDKEIYLGMIESRENKIEKLMEDLDEVNEELSSTAEELEKAKLDKKNAQKLMEEYKVQAVNATSLQEVAEKKAFELDRELKIIREEHFELSEKYTDIQLRYEGLVEELDRMVLEGYYIPEVKVSTTAPTKKEKARKNKTVKVQDVQKVSKKFPKMKGSAVAASNDDGATIISDPSTSQLAEMTAVPSVVPSSSSAHFAAMPAVELSGGVEGASTVIARIPSTVGDRPSSVSGERRASSFINTVPEGKSSTASINGIRPDVPEAPDNTAMEDCDDDDEEDGGDDDNKSTESEVVPRMGRFSMRKMQEDVLLQEKLAVHAATRMKEALQQQISALEAELQTEKQNRKADQDQAMAMREGLQMNQKVLAAEISRLTSKISEQEKSIASLNDELQIAQAASKFSGLRQSELLTRLSSIHITPSSTSPSGKEKDSKLRSSQRASSEYIDPLQDMYQQQTSNITSMSLKKKVTMVDTASGPDNDDYLQLDILGFMKDWENVQTCSKAIQVENEFGTDMGIQFDDEDFFTTMMASESDVDLNGMAGEQGEETIGEGDNASGTRNSSRGSSRGTSSRPGSRGQRPNSRQGGLGGLSSDIDESNTAGGDNQDNDDAESETRTRRKSTTFETPNKVHYKVLKEDPEIANQFEGLYQGFLEICSKYLPPHKQQLLAQDFNSRLVAQELVQGLDINWQVRQTLTLLTALNEMRNKFVEHYFHHNPMAKTMQFSLQHQHYNKDNNEEERRKQAEIKLEKANLRIVLTIRFMDLIIQVVHYLLSPLHRLQESEYPLLEKVFPIVPSIQPPSSASNHHHRRASSPTNAEQQPHAQDDLAEGSDVYTKELRQQVKNIMDTFPLTEIQLTADNSHGAPRGVLSLLQEYQSKRRSRSRSNSPNRKRRQGATASSPTHLSSYMKSMVPRSLPMDIDSILDFLERRSRSPSRDHSPATSPSPPLGFSNGEQDIDLGTYILAQYDQEGPEFLDHLTQKTGKKMEEVTVDDIMNDSHYKAGLLLPSSAVPPEKQKISTALEKPSQRPVGNKAPMAPPLPLYSTRYKPMDLSDYVDYTRLKFDKDDIISNAYHVRRAQSAGEGEREISRHAASRGVSMVNDNKDEGRGGGEGLDMAIRPFSANSPQEDRRPMVGFGGLETIASVSLADSSAVAEEVNHARSIRAPKPPKDGAPKRSGKEGQQHPQQPVGKSSHSHRVVVQPNEAAIDIPNQFAAHHHWEIPSRDDTVADDIAAATKRKNRGVALKSKQGGKGILSSSSSSRPVPQESSATTPNRPSSRPSSANNLAQQGPQSPPARYYQPRAHRVLFSSEMKVPDAATSLDGMVVNYLPSPTSAMEGGASLAAPPLHPPAPQPLPTAGGAGGGALGGLAVQGRRRQTTDREKVTGAFLSM